MSDTLTRKHHRWPLFLIAIPAAIAIWSGWVGLGQLAGFGDVAPFPGIVPWHLDTAITLPVGVEAYGAYALGVWLSLAGVPENAKTFARWSAIGALALGLSGQVAFHLLAAAHVTRAPWPVTVLVSCVPVVAFGFAVALTHLLRQPEPRPAMVTAVTPVTEPAVTEPSEPVAVPSLAAMTRQQQADTLGMTLRKLYRKIERGELPELVRTNGKAH